MDIVEFAEKFLGVTLCEWQRNHLRTLDNLNVRGNIRVAMRMPGEFYIYFDQQTQKELVQNGTTPNCHH